MKSLLTIAIVASLASFSAAAAEPSVKEKLIVQGNVVDLKDGGSIVIKDGKTYSYGTPRGDAEGPGPPARRLPGQARLPEDRCAQD